MSLTINAKTYTNDVPRNPDTMRYLGPGHTISANDFVELGRTSPKPTATYAGKGRTRMKIVRTVFDAGGLSLGDMIVDQTISIPVGALEAAKDLILADIGIFVQTASFESFAQDQLIVQ